MVERTNTHVNAEIDKLTENDTLAVLNYISELVSAKQAPALDISFNDELIMSLSDAYENQRARQVTEWERLRRQNVRRAA